MKDLKAFTVFTRNWWKMENGERVPNPRASKKKMASGLTESEARDYCSEWNKNNPEGKLSRKAEFTSNY